MDRSLNMRERGDIGESLACEYLAEKGHKIITRNFRYGRLGEVDIITECYGTLCFIEVKTRTSKKFGNPCEAIGERKIRTIKKISTVFLLKYAYKDMNIRFDVIEVFVSTSSFELKEINHIENAF
jgi:putative endonuclease